ncbi:thioesterase family protein [Mycobacterium sp. NPDC051804]|uniref:thioesterase family protein n=1 Tax=Mycobacterium sp. NPDC051804 TaxID=3364295 RepID=UPI00379F6878
MASTIAPETAYFDRRGDGYHPRSIARGGWGPLISGHVVGGLLGWAVERVVDDEEFLPARLTVDLPRPAAIEPVEVQTREIRSGKRLRLVEAVIRQEGKLVGQATGLFLRRGDQPSGTIWSPEVQMPPIPTDTQANANPLFVRTYGWGLEIQNPDDDWPYDGDRKYTWLRLTQPLFEDEPLTPFTRAAMAADVTASLVNWSSEGLKFINADYTLTLSRLPKGELIGLASQGHSTRDGIATGSAILFDERGEIGSSTSVSVAQSGFAPPPR